MEPVSLDKKDQALLHQLYLDSRQSFVRLGKKLRLSNTAAERRMRRLREEGAIQLLMADINFHKLGLRSYRLYFKFDVMDEKMEKEVLEVFERYPRTLWGVVCEGEYDVLWRIIAPDELEVERAAYLMIEKFGSRIVERTVVTTTYQIYLSWNKALGCARAPEFPMEGISSVQKVDETDLRLLKALYADARASSVALAQEVGLSPDAVNYRIRRLVREKYILGWTAWFDAKKLGFDYYKILIAFRSATREKERQFLRYCISHDAVVFINKCIGSWDIEVDVLVRDTADLHAFVQDIKTRFGHIIGKHAYVAAIEERMLNPLRGELEK
ncbi:HTH-type transcriptional regulator Ptr1 [uncultured archaeon]|nr:HTH-type transcriptional regulator Ptr1 [uncultured archaeon]